MSMLCLLKVYQIVRDKLILKDFTVNLRHKYFKNHKMFIKLAFLLSSCIIFDENSFLGGTYKKKL